MKPSAVLQNLAVSLIERCNAALDLDGLRGQVLPLLTRGVPAEALFFAVADPATSLHTRKYLDGLPRHLSPQFLDNEFHTDDVNKWVELAGAKRGVRTLHRATNGRLEDSARYRSILEPLGLGDELRAVIRVRGVCWGYMCLHRERRSVFTSAETRFVTQIVPHLAEAIRAALLLGTVEQPDLEDAPGLVVLAADGSVLSVSPPAARWLDELETPGNGLPHEFEVVAARLRGAERSIPRVHVRTRAGRWQ